MAYLDEMQQFLYDEYELQMSALGIGKMIGLL